MKYEENKGSVLGGILLIAGCCIGAAMLGLPILTAITGFRPSLAMFLVCWTYMLVTGLLLLEVNLWFKEEVSIITMAGRTLGISGQLFGWITFLFLFYSLMVAYVSGCGSLISNFTEQNFSYALPDWIGSLGTVLLFGILIFLGTGSVDRFNRLLMCGLVGTYLTLIVMGVPHVDTKLLEHQKWSAAPFVIPAMIVSFGYHNLVPSLTTYLNHDRKKLTKTIFIGSAVPLVIYLMWEYVILGLVPLKGGIVHQALNDGEMATRVLRTAVGTSWIADIAEAFAFFAIVTSLLGVALSFVDFLADGLQIKKDPRGKLILCLLTLGPPFLFGILYPNMFLSALGVAGGFGAVIIFGILPALMVWKGRYHESVIGERVVPGGKPLLILVILASLAIMGIELAYELGG